MIVDDDADIRETLAELLGDRGYDVLTAADGAAGLQLLRCSAVPPRLILLDLMMPVLDGYGFLREQRADPRLAGVPVAVITAGHAVDRARLGEQVPVIAKPFNLSTLMTTVEDHARGTAP